jgi:site-specific recombinase XerD
VTEEQGTLFPKSGLTAKDSIQAAMGAFENHMLEEGLSPNTIKAFASDIRLLIRFLPVGQAVGDIGTKDLNDFLNWLLYDRGVPCSRKSYARRVTTLKFFFGWLHESGVLPADPSAAVIQVSVTSPLPTLPTETQLEQALAVTATLRQGHDQQKPDARPHLLLTLLLQTAIKKSEAMGIVPNHIDRDDPDNPFLFVRYRNPQQRYKERKLPLDPDWLAVLDEYLAQYKPTETLFTCTARNLEYVLSDVAEQAGLEKGLLSFENLRWVSALRDLNSGVNHTTIRQKLGLSPVTWRETKSRLEKLASRQRELASG